MNNFYARDEDIERRIDELLVNMTLKEKAGQLSQFAVMEDSNIVDDHDMALVKSGKKHILTCLKEKGLDEKLRKGEVGSLLLITGAESINYVQRIAVEETRLGIPILIASDVIHGYRTLFPIPLAEACSWDLRLIEETAASAAEEAAAAGIHWIYAPMVDIARDPRWGRIAEGAGEDPLYGSLVAEARVKGLQRADVAGGRPRVAATIKHFAAYGATEGGRDYNTTDMSDGTLRETYLPPYRAAVAAGAASVMTSFNDLNGVPATGNRYLLDRILREEWQYDGVVVSDWKSINEMVNHGYAEDEKDAVAIAMNAGVHVDLNGWIYDVYLEDLVIEGRVAESIVDEAVRKMLRMKFALNLFEQPYADPATERRNALTPDRLALAREAATKSMVLLRNEGELLPLTASLSKIAVIGPFADNRKDLMGCWNCEGREADVMTVLEAIRERAGACGAAVAYAEGCSVEGGSDSGLEEAASIARTSDIAIVVLGESLGMSGENQDRTDLNLPGIQRRLLQAIHATGTPVVLVLMNGRPLSLTWEDEHVPAILEAWHGGTQAAPALADILFGHANPSGRLVASFPRTVGQLPVYYNRKNTGRPHMQYYYDGPATALYPFGYGLGYTRFSYRGIGVSKEEIVIGDTIDVYATVTNEGARPGRETVQLYMQDVAASVTRPIRQLMAFRQIDLAPGESREVRFTLHADELGFIGVDGNHLVEPGKFRVWISPHSGEENERAATFALIALR